MSSNIQETRRDVGQLTTDIRILTEVANTGTISLGGISSILLQLNLGTNIEQATITLISFIALVQTAQRALEAFHISLGPVGWAFLIIGLGATVTLGQQMRSTQA